MKKTKTDYLIDQNASLEELINDFGGGRKKENKTSQKFYDLTNKLIPEFTGSTFYEIEMFTEYFKTIAKKLSVLKDFDNIVCPSQI